MKYATFTRCLLPWLLVAVCPPLLNHCGGETEPGTETGNPPEIDERLLDIVAGAAEGTVEVVGAAGAVSPGAVVSVTNLRTGARAEAAAATDGSVSVVVSGSLADEYEVTVSLNGRSETIRVSADSNDGASGSGGGDGSGGNGASGTLSSAECAALEEQLENQITAGYGAADATCSSDADCQTVVWNVGCYSKCVLDYLSVSGISAAESTIEQDTAPTCAALTGCERLPPASCPPFALPVSQCINGTCRGDDLLAQCEDLDREAGSRMRELLDGANKACAGDGDCTLINPSVSCSPDCGNPAAVASTASEAVLQSIDDVDQTVCGQYTASACPAPIPLPCVPPAGDPAVTCLAGRCELRLIPF